MTSDKENEFKKRLLAAFEIEAAEHAGIISKGVALLEQDNPACNVKEITETVFRATHSLKGAARAVDMTDIEALCKSLENVFAIWKKDSPLLEHIKTVYLAVDAIVDTLENKTCDGTRLHQLAYALDELVNNYQGRSLSMISTPPSRYIINMGDALRESGDLSGNTSEMLSDAVHHKTVMEILPDTIEGKEQVNTTASKGIHRNTHKEGKSEDTTDFIRISASRLDKMLLQAEEMICAKLSSGESVSELSNIVSMFDQWSRQFSDLDGSSARNIQDFAKNIGNSLNKLLCSLDDSHRSLNMMVDHLLKDVKQLLMLPFSSVTEMLPKMVRDLARDQGKEVFLEIAGSSIEIDRRILEQIKAPLIHIIRNAVDHGIESPRERFQLGKDSRGRIAITLCQVDADKVELTISDDGRGMDTGRIKASAVNLGKITQEDADSLTIKDSAALVFQSGITTSPIVTDISGRGLGLAIVQEKVEQLGGKVSVHNTPGKGIEFNICLPLTLASFRGIFVRSSGQIFIVPTSSVDRVIRIRQEDIQSVENKEVICVDNQTIPLIRLSDALELSSGINTVVSKNVFIQAFILRYGEKRIAFSVEQVIREDEGLVKNLGPHLSKVRAVSGAAVYGKGKIAPILNVPDLMECAKSVSRREIVSHINCDDKERFSILLAEDSGTSRMLLKNILESKGYVVKTAVDGMDAWKALKEDKYDILVSDIDMPRMNGFVLTEKIRADKVLSDLPVILVTARDSREDREHGIDAGANAYIVKSNFDQSNLMEVVQRFV